MSRKKVRVDFGDEVSWAEHIEGDIYRSLNHTLSNVLLDLPKDHEFSCNNGNLVNLRWGMIFRATVLSEFRVRPVAIIGQDLTPVEEA
jgi:hypothetical protein